MTRAEQFPNLAPPPPPRVETGAPPGPVPSRQGRPLRVAFIVTEFPKTTETFILRDVMAFHRLGCEVRVYHLTHFNRHETLHDFARPVLDWARDTPYLASRAVLGAAMAAGLRQGEALAQVLRDIRSGCRSDPVMLLKSLFILPKSLRIAEELSDWGCDHVHAAYAGHPATAAWIVRRMTGIPFSLSSHAHDLFETQALLAQKLPEADFVRTISAFNRDFILDHVPALGARPPVVIHVGADLSSPPVRPRGGPFRLLYVGSLEYRKGVDVLLNALPGLNFEDWQLDILGDGPERRRLEAQAARLGLASRVRFRGRQGNDAVLDAMKAASVLVVPSRIGPRNQTEGLPTVIVEAMSLRLPVIASRLTGIPEIVHPGRTGLLVAREDIPGLARAIASVHADPAAAARRAKAGRALVEAEFDQQANAARLFALVRQSVEARP
ncbi:MAG: glycosyltransferase [Paracoccaceae bacterium]|nr:glycosyltransferase [Paracoccaceae bacterium]